MSRLSPDQHFLKRRVPFFSLALLFVLLLADQASAGDVVVRVKGGAYLQGTTEDTALKQAREEAERRAVEEGGRTVLASQTQSYNMRLVQDVILAETTGIITQRVWGRSWKEDGKLWVELTATVSNEKVRADYLFIDAALKSKGYPSIGIAIDREVKLTTEVRLETDIDLARERTVTATTGEADAAGVIVAPGAVALGAGEAQSASLSKREEVTGSVNQALKVEEKETPLNSALSEAFFDGIREYFQTVAPEMDVRHGALYEKAKEAKVRDLVRGGNSAAAAQLGEDLGVDLVITGRVAIREHLRPVQVGGYVRPFRVFEVFPRVDVVESQTGRSYAARNEAFVTPPVMTEAELAQTLRMAGQRLGAYMLGQLLRQWCRSSGRVELLLSGVARAQLDSIEAHLRRTLDDDLSFTVKKLLEGEATVNVHSALSAPALAGALESVPELSITVTGMRESRIMAKVQGSRGVMASLGGREILIGGILAAMALILVAIAGLLVMKARR